MSIAQVKEIIRKFLEIIVCSFFSYVALMFLTWAISSICVNPGVAYEIRKSMHEGGCEPSVETKSVNPFNVFSFYLDFDYWTASYWVGIAEFNDPKCQHLLIESMNKFKKYSGSIKVHVIDKDSNILMSIKRYAPNDT